MKEQYTAPMAESVEIEVSDAIASVCNELYAWDWEIVYIPFVGTIRYHRRVRKWVSGETAHKDDGVWDSVDWQEYLNSYTGVETSNPKHDLGVEKECYGLSQDACFCS